MTNSLKCNTLLTELEEAKNRTARVVALGGKPVIGYIGQPIFDELKALFEGPE